MRVLCACLAAAFLCAMLVARPARAAGANIGLYTDVTGNTCSFSGNNPGPITAYVVFRPDFAGVNTVQFSAPVPACLGAVYVGETVTPGMMKFGNSQTGVSIVLQSCYTQPVSVLRINYMRSGSTQSCCPYPILPAPSMGSIAASGCDYSEIPTTSVVAHFNADATCECVGNSPPIPPSAPSPANQTSSHSVIPLMTWTSQDFDNNIAGYDVYLGTTTTPPLAAAGLATANYTPSTPLAELTQHYWRVVVRDAFGLEESGPTWTFTTRAANSPPSSPYEPSPANTATDVLLAVTLAWQGADIDGDPLMYDVYFGTASSPPLVAANQTISTFTPALLTFSVTYYWRVVARDIAAHETSGPVWSFVTRPANYPPSVPLAPVPSNNATNRPIDQRVSWSASDRDNDPLTFDVYFGTVSPPPLVVTAWPAATYDPDTLSFSTPHYWRIVARDPAGAETSGPTWTFTTRPSNLPPNAPSNPVPANAATNRPVDQTLAWTGTDPDADVVKFDVYFGTAVTPPLVASNVAASTYSPGALGFSTRYYWRIVARDSKGAATSGPTWRFNTMAGNSPPTPPANPSPPDGATNVSAGPVLSWSASDPEGQFLYYDVYLGTSPNPPLVATNRISPSYAPPILVRGMRYYWRVLARDTGGLTTLGPLWTFTTIPGNSPPGEPAGPSPVNGASDITRNPTLTWSCSDPDLDAITYRVYLGPGPNPPLVASNLVSRSFKPATLAYATGYQWRVVATDAHGDSTSGVQWSFTTAASNRAPSVPSYPSPSDGASGVSPTANLSWSSGDPDGDLVTYDVYFGTGDVPPLVATSIVNRTYSPGALALATRYYWHVVARDTVGAAASGPTWSFTTKPNTPPTAASSPWPWHGGASGPSYPVLTWTASDVDGQSLTYAVYFGRTSSPPLVVSSTPEPQYAPGRLEIGRAYYWRVDVSDGVATTPGSLWNFVVRQPGDLVQDGVLTLADAQCAMDVALWNPDCGGAAAYTVGDVDCGGAVTPRDARCIHKAAIDGSCELCDRAVAGASARGKRTAMWPVVSLASTSTRADTLVVRLSAANVPSLEAFGFYSMSNAKMPMIGAARRGASSDFEIIEVRTPSLGTSVIGAYTLASAAVTGTGEFIELYFDMSRGINGDILISGFVDDLMDAPQLFIDLGPTVEVRPATQELALHQNYPNPFNPRTTITYELPASTEREGVRLRIIDLSGRLVKTLVDEEQGGGSHRVEWQGKDDRGAAVSSGVYFYVLDVGGERLTRKLVLLK